MLATIALALLAIHPQPLALDSLNRSHVLVGNPPYTWQWFNRGWC
ncbi:MAG TPA: hypothetical protein VG122_07265 [Gemmata sp.]|nr:hypothetical protein [Gemmata sp.]